MMDAQAHRQRVSSAIWVTAPAVGLVVVLQAEQRQHRRPVVGVVGPDVVVLAEVPDPGPTYPAQVEAISSWMSPWFHAKLWLVRGG